MASWNIEALFRRYRSDLHRFLKRRIPSHQTTDDLVQQAFLELMCSTPAAPVRNVQAYLFRIAGNLAVDHLRGERIRRHRFVEGHDTEFLLCDAPNAERVLDYKDRVRVLASAIAELPPRCRQVFLLHRFDDKSHSEIAEHLGITRSMVEKHVMKAMGHCRDRLDGILDE